MSIKIWKVIPGFEGYEVSNEGDVRNIKTKRIMKINYSANGKPSIVLKCINKDGEPAYSTKAVHRLMWIAFKGEIDRHSDVIFKDGNPYNCALDNLELMTSASRINKFKSLGTDRKDAKLNDEKVRIIKIMTEISIKTESLPHAFLATFVNSLSVKYDVHPTTIRQIVRGARWKHIKLSDDDMDLVDELLNVAEELYDEDEVKDLSVIYDELLKKIEDRA